MSFAINNTEVEEIIYDSDNAYSSASSQPELNTDRSVPDKSESDTNNNDNHMVATDSDSSLEIQVMQINIFSNKPRSRSCDNIKYNTCDYNYIEKNKNLPIEKANLTYSEILKQPKTVISQKVVNDVANIPKTGCILPKASPLHPMITNGITTIPTVQSQQNKNKNPYLWQTANSKKVKRKNIPINTWSTQDNKSQITIRQNADLTTDQLTKPYQTELDKYYSSDTWTKDLQGYEDHMDKLAHSSIPLQLKYCRHGN